MARLVAVCRNGEDGFSFKKRQIPLAIDDTLTLVMEFPDTLLSAEGGQVNSAQLKQFTQHYELLSGQELVCAVRVPPRELVGCLPEQVACVGCRGSVERLFSALLESGTPALEPLLLESSGELVVCRSYLADARKLYCLFYLHGAKLNDILDSIPKSKKNRRCPFHSLDTHKAKPLGGSWTDVWDRMSQDCRDEVVLIDSDCLLETLETHLRKHRFCGECKTKVLRAYAILTGEVDGSKEKGYCAGLYEGLRSCPHERHVHVSCDTNFISHLLGRAVSELAGGRRERHAKTLDSAQEEVVTCLAIHLYERLHRIWQRLRAEEQTWQLLFHLGVDALRKSFEVAVERKQGVSRIDMLCEELWEEERARELRQEKKRQKRRNRRKNKFGVDGADANADLAEPAQEDADASDDGDGINDTIPALPAAGASPAPPASEAGDGTCMCLFAADGPQAANGHAVDRTEAALQGTFKVNGSSDCGYSSSAEGSEPGSQDGSEGSGQGDAADPRKDFPGWLKSQGMSGRIAAAIDKELGISNYDILLACSEDAEVKADLLKAAKEKMPFAFYAVLRRVVEKISPTPSQSPPPQSPTQQQQPPPPPSAASRNPAPCPSTPAASAAASSSSSAQGKGSLFFPPPSLGPALGLFSASKVPVVGATFPLPRVAAAAAAAGQAAAASRAGKPVDGALKTLGFSSLLQSAQKLRELEKVLLDATQPKGGGDAGGGAGAPAGNGVRQDKSIAELLQSALNLSELADGREARATVSTDAAGFTSLKQNKELTELIESAKRLSNMYISEAGKEKAEAAKAAKHQDGGASSSSGQAPAPSEAPKSAKAPANGLTAEQRLANLVQAVQKSSVAYGIGHPDLVKELKVSAVDGRAPPTQHSASGGTGCRADSNGVDAAAAAGGGCCPECTAKSALPPAAEAPPDSGKKKKKKKKNQGQQADEVEDAGGAAAVCTQLKLGVCVRCDGCGAVGHRPPDKALPLLAAAIAQQQQPEPKKAQAMQAQTTQKQTMELKQPAQKQGAKKQVEVKQEPAAKPPDGKHKQPDAKQPAQRQAEAKQPGQRPPDGKQPAQKQPDGKQATQKQQEVKPLAPKQADGKQPAQKQEIKQPAHKQADVKQAAQKQQDGKQPLPKQQEGKQAAVQKSNGVQKANDQRVAQQNQQPATRAQQQQQKQQQQSQKKGGQKRGSKQPAADDEKQDPARSLADMLSAGQRDVADDADDVTKPRPSPPVQRHAWEEDDNDDCFPDTESFISPDEIRSFKASHRAFYVQRDQYRQQLQERFNQYCNAHNGPCDQRCCNGKWLATAGVK